MSRHSTMTESTVDLAARETYGQRGIRFTSRDHNGIRHFRKAFGPLATLCIIAAMGALSAQALTAKNACADQVAPVTIEQIMEHLRFEKSFKTALLEGKILSTGMPEMEQLREELAVAAVMLVVRAPMEKVVAAYLDKASFQQNSDIIAYRMIRVSPESESAPEEDFKSIGLSPDESSEVDKLIGFKGGSTFNLSQDEINRLQDIDLKASDLRDKVSLLVRAFLMQRFQSYLLHGLEGVEPYVRDKGKHAYPRRELTVAVGSATLLDNHFPGFYRNLLKFPEKEGQRIENEFYWFKKKMDNRPVFQLSHYMADIGSHYAIVAELQFYVENTYNSMLTIIGCIPYEDGTVVFCTNRTFTDQVAGFGSSLKRKIGRRRIEDTIADHFAKLRSKLETKAP